MSGAGLFSPRARLSPPLSGSHANSGTGTDDVLRNPFLRDEEIADYQQELKITIAENDTTDFGKTHSINYSSSRFVATGERRKRREERGERREESGEWRVSVSARRVSVSAAANVRCGKQEHPIEKACVVSVFPTGRNRASGKHPGPTETVSVASLFPTAAGNKPFGVARGALPYLRPWRPGFLSARGKNWPLCPW